MLFNRPDSTAERPAERLLVLDCLSDALSGLAAGGHGKTDGDDRPPATTTTTATITTATSSRAPPPCRRQPRRAQRRPGCG